MATKASITLERTKITPSLSLSLALSEKTLHVDTSETYNVELNEAFRRNKKFSSQNLESNGEPPRTAKFYSLNTQMAVFVQL